MEEEKTIDLLEDMKKANQKNLMYQRISTILMLIFVLAILFLIPDVVSTLDTAKSTLTHLNEAITTMETTLESVQDVVDDGGVAIEDTMTKIEEIDFETLNQAITDLSDVVEPLADFFGVFSRN